MATPIKGTSGSIKIGPTMTQVTVGRILNYEINFERNTQELGPYIGEDIRAIVATGLAITGSAEGEIPQTGDAGQDDVIDALTAGSEVQLVFESTLGKTITITAAIVTTLTVGAEAENTVTIAFEFASANAAYTIAQDT